GDRVWVDTNANGVQDNGEVGKAGVTVELYACVNDVPGALLDTTATDANGNYAFTGLMPGDYIVKFIAADGTVLSTANVGDDAFDSDADADGFTGCYTLASGENNTSVDAGVYQTAAIGDRVWVDANGNGRQDDGEANVAGVKVYLLNSVGTAIDSQVTDANGNYHFINLVPGTYSIKFDLATLPAGYTVTSKDAALATDLTDSDADAITGITAPTVLESGEDDRSWDLGIKGNVGIDIEKLVHGEYLVQDCLGGEGLTPGFWKTHSVAGPAPLSGWPETGLSPSDSYEAIFGVNVPNAAPSLMDALNTAGGGMDALLRHSAAAYLNASDPYISYAYTKAQIVSMVQSAFTNGTYETTKNLFQTQNELGADLNTPANVGSTLVVTPDVDADTSGSGPIIPVGGTAVFTYIVKNTGSVELSNISVFDDRIANLTFVGGDTDNDGKLDVNETWTYTAHETVVSGTEYVNIGTVTGEDRVSGQTVTDSDAAHYNTPGLTQSLGDRVWEDSNANGVQDLGEAGIAGVTVRLTDTNGVVQQTTSTDAQGNYLFNVAAGSYKVNFDAVAGYVVTGKDLGGNDNRDSDIDTVTRTTGIINIAAGEQDLSIDAGFYKKASLGDRIWVDTNANGQQDDGATGVNGVTVTLIGGGADGIINGVGDTSQTTVTAGDGNYLFTNLTPGQQYQVLFGKPTGYNFTTANAGNDASDSDADVVTGKSQVVTLTSGESNLTIDAGLVAQKAAIGDHVWLDCNANGIQDAGEVGAANVTVKLLNSAGTVIATQQTNANGDYLFSNLNPGDYSVQFVALAGYSFTSKDANGNLSDGLDSDADVVTGKTALTTLSAGETDLSWDAGLSPVCRPVTFDFSGNSYTSGTLGNSRTYTDALTGVSVTARAFSQDKGTNTWQNAFLGAYGGGLGVTDSSEGSGGNNTHTVDNIGRNNYIVLQFSQAVLVDKAFLGYVVNDSDAQIWIGNSATAVTSMNNSVLNNALFTEVDTTTLTTSRWVDINDGGVRGNLFIIAADTTDTSPEDYFKLEQVSVCAPDYCAPVAKASLGDFVWEDKNYNGVQDTGENGISGVTVNLLSSAGTVLASTTTNASGAYAFTNLNPGDYKVQVVTPSGYYVTKKDLGGNDLKDSDIDTTGTTAVVTLTAGENDLSVDAGLYRKASVGDKVWEDTNHNWIQDTATDPGIGGVKVNLMNATGTTVLATTYTNASGNYLFANLDPGTYVLQFDKTNVIYRNTNMNIWKWAVKDVGLNDAIDSDVKGDGVATTNVTKTDAFTLASGQNDMTRDAAITPIAIDLDGNGIHTVSRANSTGTFDLFGNGAGIHSGWLSGGDGFLAVDHNGNGQVDSISELFGGMAKGAGFANLAAYDSNHDGVVDKSDAHFNDLMIWRDANGNHQTDAGELNSLAAHGIASLAVGYTEVPFLDDAGNLHLERSSATLADGSSVDMTDVYFNVSADDAAAAGVTLPSIGELLGNDASLDSVLSGLGASAATAPTMADNAVDSGAADALKQMAALYDQTAIAA
ncbi:MAG: carboxypeptidase regulatory-like domain-containing protein, partial [Gammaproteobacteria bacterium]|nr:carboxypeptidase regulatory-like domain-containing protein [Gammaproteobacteria bacterium]